MTPKAVKLLSKPEYKLNKAVLQTRRYEDKKSSSFIDLQVDIMKAYLDIKDAVGNPDDTVVLTASEMAKLDRDNYLRSLPSLEVRTDTGYRCLIDIIPDDQHLFLAKKRIRKYIEHYEGEEWEWDNYPDVYIVRRSAADMRRLKAYIEEKMEDTYIDEDEFGIFVIKSAEEFLD